jgi:hypothetical protein
MPPLTIRKPETLLARLEKMEAQAFTQANNTNQKTAVSVRINGFNVQSVVTPPAYQKGRFYRMFYVNGKRVAKDNLIADRILLNV